MKAIIATLAAELGDPKITADAIRKWEERGRVPHRVRLPLIDLAKDKRIKLTAADFDFVPLSKRRSARTK